MPLQHLQESPFPMELKAKVGGHTETAIDEKCSCGHLRSEHHDTLAYGHGPCAMEDGVGHDCPCLQFTWWEHVFAS
jgi:hypothetical protein